MTDSDAKMKVDTGAHQLALEYAQALIGAAEKAGKTDHIVEQFDSLIVDILNPNPKLESIFESAFINEDEKVNIVERLFAKQADILLLNFLKIVAKHDRLSILRAIHRATEMLYDELKGRVEVEVRTAQTLEAAQLEEITLQINKLIQGEPKVVATVDSQLLGGLVLRVGDTIYDGSVSTQLKSMRDQMIERSVHEIQSGRDRFSNTSGN